MEIMLDKENSMTVEKAEVKQEIKRTLNRFGKGKGNLVPILQKVQGKFGYLSREAMGEIAEFLHIPEILVCFVFVCLCFCSFVLISIFLHWEYIYHILYQTCS